MSEAEVIHYASQLLMLVLVLSMPTVIVAAVVGTLVSLVQSLTQIQDQTLSFAIKLIAVSITIMLTARWLGIEIYHFSMNILDHIELIGPS
ncbi:MULTISPECIES: type III secretion system export apparatus subunit SctS [Hahella]|uniref:Type III secretory pathway, component EscS n=1 Tax=Hahella chejuensis (strain KCTC 2396) TaxID=349521 RepID=Q2SC31_HAHCH|nr:MULTISPECIES: type III secretion system export apparatus subunit SctS [Hahella]ABC31793.1 Type III secretory pathway, component EscS [Hahella chejuensis KCTC 2396]AZZ91035.1 EscS/YscS/HrcS family type III secretion system export apparatus protein [Hahella sp. KA22]MBU6949814.1 type III secretion system export apparatus subunit SctS [Hahella sp. HN01]MDG9668395.1 type III secretion system export apparatus subunit SctS [Hahella sp. CR1]QAY54405.1 EscS/YscS/HrcS family type III secretion syste